MEYNIEKFKTFDLILISSIAVVLVFMELVSTAIEAYVPIGGRLIYIFDTMFMMTIVFIVRKFGTLTIGGLLAGVLALPLPIFIVPGLFNVVIHGFSAFLGDLTIYLFAKREKLASVLGPGIVIASNAVMFAYFLTLMGLPLGEQLVKILPFAMALGFVLGGAGGFLGYRIYKRIENKPYVKRLGR